MLASAGLPLQLKTPLALLGRIGLGRIGALFPFFAVQQSAKDGIAIDPRDTPPDDAGLFVDERAHLAIANRP